MPSIKKILVAVADPQHPSRTTLDRAVALASLHGAQIELFTCVYNQYLAGERFFDSPGLKKSRDSLVASKRRKLEIIAAELTERGVSVSVAAQWDYPIYEGIVRHVMELGPDLLIAESTAHSRLARIQLTNTDWQLVRTCPCPLLLAKSEDWKPYHFIVAAVDPMHDHDKPASLDHKILEFAKLFATGDGVTLQVLHAFSPITSIAAAGPEPMVLPVDYTEEMLEEAHREALDRLVRAHGMPPESAHLKGRSTETAILEFVSGSGADLVVMGAVSRSMLKRLFIGSTAERVLDELPCDVLVVKPDGFETKVKAEHRHAVEG